MKLDLSEQVQKLQKQPYETRVKILWAAVAISAIVLLGIWVFGLKNTLSNINGKSLLQATPASGSDAAESQTQFVAIERVEQSSTALKIYFNINNTTSDILNVSKIGNIGLEPGGVHPTQMTDRQGQPFVQKILSHTQNFGILTFGNMKATDVKLTFDQMFFENNPNNLFKQTLDLDFNKLNDKAEVRN